MKDFLQTKRHSQQVFATLVLTSLLSLGVGITLLEKVAANPLEHSPSVANGTLKLSRKQSRDRLPQSVYRSERNSPQVKLKKEPRNMDNVNLPEPVANAVLGVASKELGLPISQLKIVKVEQQTWRDRCLGLSSPTEKCIGTRTPGWRVSVEARKQSYIYRTNDSGSQVRTEAIAGLPPNNDDLPYPVAKAVLQDAQILLNLPASRLRILQAEQQTWADACLGLASPGKVCTQAIVPGWRVTVDGKTQTLVYRTNDSGSLVKVEKTVEQPWR